MNDEPELEIELPNSNSRSNLTKLDARPSCAITPTSDNSISIYGREREGLPDGFPDVLPDVLPEATWAFYIHKLVLHVSFHITLLSILEPLFFFYFAIPMEKDILYDQLESFTHYQEDIMDTHNAQLIRDQPFYTIFIEFIDNENTNIDEFLVDMHESTQEADDKNDKFNQDLEQMAYLFPICSGSFTVFYYISVQYFYRYKSIGLQILGEHLTLMVFVAAYELWFFTHVILKYHPFTTEGIMEFLINCMLVRVFNHYPELHVLEQNHTAVCEVR